MGNFIPQFISDNRYSGQKRQNVLDWDAYFMAIATLSAMRSKDPKTQVGACIVNDKNVIVGVGYNGLPRGCHDDKFPWVHKKLEDPSYLESKGPYVCHAEMNAIMNSNSQDLEGCTIYQSQFPCNECSKLIIQKGIKSVVYGYNKDFTRVDEAASIRMLEAAKVHFKQYMPIKDRTLDQKIKQIQLTVCVNKANSSDKQA